MLCSDQIDFQDRMVTIVGGLARDLGRHALALLVERGAIVRRDVARHTAIMVVSHQAHRQLKDGRLQRKLQRADAAGALCLSENMLLDRLGLLPVRPTPPGAVSLEALPGKAGLSLEQLRLLVLFDVIQPQADGCSFRDLVVAREVARLLADGIGLANIIESADRAADKSDLEDRPLARLKLVSDRFGRIAARIGTGLAELDGQLRLPLAEGDNPSIDDLFEAAEDAEQAGDPAAAASLYQRCVRLDRRDPIAAFNLANVLRELGQTAAAKFHLRLAVAIDDGFADAWYNLALLMDAEGATAAARAGFERAIAADPDYADPVYNLAQLHFEAGAFAEAGRLWQRYLALDPDSEWARRARYGLALCRRHGAS